MRLMDCLAPVLAYAAYLLEHHEEVQPNPEAVLADLDRLIGKAESRARKAGRTGPALENARFAVAAFIDEAILLSDWEGREAYADHTLQRRLYQTTNAGEEFFTRIAALTADEQEVLEVYATCLVLGFKGRYFHESQAPELAAIKSDALKKLLGQDSSGFDPTRARLFPEAYPAEFKAKKHFRLWGRWHPMAVACFFLPPMALATLLVVYHYMINRAIYTYLHHIR